MPGSFASESVRRHPSGMWSQYRELSRDFWTFFVAALFYEAGFGLYFFLFNLYLLDFHFDEKAIGLINGALSVGLLVSTLPVGFLTRKIGNQPLLLFCFVVAPLLGVLRAVWMWEPAQIGLAAVAGLVMSIWTVCFLPVSASFTSESNRASAIGLIFSVGIGATALGSAASGYLSHWIGVLSPSFDPAEVKRIVLLASCGVAALGALPLLRLPNHVPATQANFTQASPAPRVWDLQLLRNSFLRRYLPCMALWSSLLAAFTPFASVYFARERHIALTDIGLIFSISQMAQLVAGLLIPIILRRLGMLKAILATQLGTALLLIGLVAGQHAWCLAAFVMYSATQWMSSTAIYTLLMNVIAEADRSAASAMTMFANSLMTACATSATGALLVHFGYTSVLMSIAALEAVVAILFWLLMQPRRGSSTTPEAALCAESITD
jgi:MFS family permease